MRARDATIEDVETVRSLCAQLGYPLSADETAARLARVLGSPNDRVWVAVGGADERVVGYLHAFRRWSLETPPQVTVQSLVVDRAARRLGVGRLLMAAAEAWAVAEGLGRVGLHTRRSRADARGFYEALGYDVFARSLAYKKPLG